MLVKDHIWAILLKLMKRWTRAQLLPLLDQHLSNLKDDSVILSIGGYGIVDDYLRLRLSKSSAKLITFDIDPSHQPDILGDIQHVDVTLANLGVQPELIVALEVLEHVGDPEKSIVSCHTVLSRGGIFIFSTPWIIPIHDKPNDFWRFTPHALKKMSNCFKSVSIYARGSYFDSVIALLLRGLFASRLEAKILMTIGIILSISKPKPRLYPELEAHESTIGYVTVCTKGI